MGILMVFYFMLQLPWLIPAADSDCNEMCGTVAIPFPFGIKTGCYISSWFRVTCNKTANGPKPFISSINLELLGKFRPYDKLIAVENPVTYLNCGNKGSNGTTSASSVNLTGSPFFFSSRYNRFGSVGCGNLVFVSRDIRTDRVVGSCLQRRCGDPTSKSGGCHDELIKENLTSYTVSMIGVTNPRRIQRCTSAFMFDSSMLKSSDLDPRFPYDISIDTTKVPATLEWNPIKCDFKAELCQEVKGAENQGYPPPQLKSPTLPLPYKDSCIERCGNFDITFPFGIKDGCYMNHAFRVTCNQTVKGLRPFISSVNLQLLEISFSKRTAVINNPITYSGCLDEDRETNVAVKLNLTGTPFLFSDVFNRFVSFGCGCATFLSNSTDDSPDGYCLQPRCGNNVTSEMSCSSGIPSGLSSFAVTVTPIYPSNGSNRSCGSAFVVDERYIDSVEKMIPYHNVTKNRSLLHVPTTLQWGTQKRGLCELREGSDIFCRSDGEYCWTSLGQTHLCVCTSDPYVDSNDVCQESGKCRDLKYKHCYMLCLNTTPGNNCSSSCPVGYEYIKDMCRPISPRIVTKEPKSSHILPIIVGCSTSIGTIFVLLSTWYFYKLLAKRNKIKLKQKYFKKNGGLLLQQRLSNNEEGNVEKIKLFSSKELEKATDYYNENRVLGRGGQGIVYKGMLTDGSIVAIKRCKLVGGNVFDETKLQQFINEVMICSQINHRNVVKLLGCCLETQVPLLVYEFVPNGTLYHLIHEPNEDFPLTWEMRLRIAIEIANALSYLHSAASVSIYHRDIKSSNILLDDKYRAKVSDFGTSRSVALEQTHLTTRVQGTFGYLDPEYFRSSKFTEKSDVYSFGVVLVELLTGQKPISSSQSEEVVRSLVNYFLLSMKDNFLLDLVDTLVMNDGPKEEIIAVAKLSKRCLNLNGKKRPTMKQVALELEWIRSSKEAIAIRQSLDEHSDTDGMIEASDIASCSTSGSILNDSVTLSLDA
ncbi:Detected protein of unknown function [Hibiscus syriacus]|uniref:Protein kinase domain-containing protein n=1 Tax=Hibiscus syriacus TaxID=106335 RepID=A0A6A3A4F9_HIBSY|nr:wall-associated receptor kinase-like 1 [Hibiscus syriacus]KAE8699191.1 Detected protein of unknown function [Hibiscus syriacus]